MELKEGMYARLINDAEDAVIILKIFNVFDKTILTENDGSIHQGEYTKENVLKASYNIIDLIEEGDYVNGVLITSISENDRGKYVFGFSEGGFEGEIWFYSNEIKSIVTKEQFESMSYKVGE